MVEIAFTGDMTFTKHLQNAWHDENLLDERKKYIYHKPHMKQYSWLQWLLKWELPLCKEADRGWNILRGRILAVFGLWRLGNKKMIRYILER